MNRIAILFLTFFSSCNASVTSDRSNVQSMPGEVSVLNHITSFKTGERDLSSAEVIAFDEASKRLFVVNSIANQLDVISLNDPADPKIIKKIPLVSEGGGINSVASKDGIVAVAIENVDPLKEGFVLFMNIEGEIINKVQVGVMPDMVTFTPDRKYLLSANEGEPKKDYSEDPEGSVSIIDLAAGIKNVKQSDVFQISFASYNDSIDDLRKRGIRIYGPGSSVAQDLEPEYIAISTDSKSAFVTLQENNALAIIDIEKKKIKDIQSFGLKDFSAESCGMAASDKRKDVTIRCCPVKGMFQPDAINAFEVKGETYLITANEGEIRDYETFNEETRIKKKEILLDPFSFSDSRIKSDEEMGRLKVSRIEGDYNKDGKYEQLICFGARSFAIWNKEGKLIYDSGDKIERITSTHPASADFFNASNSSSEKSSRSDDKGPEPEGVTTAVINGRTIAFLALERVGGVMSFDVSNPENPQFLQYVNNRSVSGAEDLGPETVLFIPEEKSPDGKPLLLVANEVSSTIGIYRVNEKF